MRSLAVRIPLWYGGLIAGCLLAYSGAIMVASARHIEAELDHQVHEDLELAQRSIVLDQAGRPSWRDGVPPWSGIHEEPGGGHWLEVWTADGRRLLADGTIGPMDLGPLVGAGVEDPHTHRVGPRSYHVVVEAMELGGRRHYLRAAVSEAASRAEMWRLCGEVLALSLAVLVLGAVGGFWISRRLVGPLTVMAGHAQRITAERLHERVPMEGTSTELDQLARAFNDAMGRLEASFAHLKRFTADVSHELRTPLTALRTVGEVALRSEGTSDEYREAIGSMLEEVDRLTRLTDELLTLARADAGEARLHLDTVDLVALAAEVAGHLSVLAEEKEQVLVIEGESSLPTRVDRVAMRQSLVNLVVNAIKYAPERTRVCIRALRREGEALLEVADQGPGIGPEHQERVFERFYRVDRSRSREMGGTGLGLSLVKWAAEAHGGRVELESAIGGGSTFRIVVPAGAPPGGGQA